jgi:hypothetical protein
VSQCTPTQCNPLATERRKKEKRRKRFQELAETERMGHYGGEKKRLTIWYGRVHVGEQLAIPECAVRFDVEAVATVVSHFISMSSGLDQMSRKTYIEAGRPWSFP